MRLTIMLKMNITILTVSRGFIPRFTFPTIIALCMTIIGTTHTRLHMLRFMIHGIGDILQVGVGIPDGVGIHQDGL